MKNTKKKIFALMVSLVTLLSVFVPGTFAEEICLQQNEQSFEISINPEYSNYNEQFQQNQQFQQNELRLPGAYNPYNMNIGNYPSGQESDSNEGLVLNKYATDNGDGSFNITLEAYSTKSTGSVGNAEQYDIIVMFDRSETMNQHFYDKNDYYQKIYESDLDTRKKYLCSF